MRKGWEYKKLGEVGTFLRGKNILKSDFVEKVWSLDDYSLEKVWRKVISTYKKTK
jgi:hypothetical protein